MTAIEALLAEIDAAWDRTAGKKLELHVIGCGALMLQANYERGTKDGDVLETSSLDPATAAQLTALAGRDSDIHVRRRMYIDVVQKGLPFLPHPPAWNHLGGFSATLRHFEVWALDVVDVVVSKLARFHANDRSDVSAMIEKGLISHRALVDRFLSAVDAFMMDARAEDLPTYVSRLNELERDELFVEETTIELPDWIGR